MIFHHFGTEKVALVRVVDEYRRKSQTYSVNGMDILNLFLGGKLHLIANDFFGGHMWSDFDRLAKGIEKVLTVVSF